MTPFRDRMLRLDPRLSRVNTLAVSPDNRYLLAVGVKPLVGGLLAFSRVALWDLTDPAATPRPGIDEGFDPKAGYFLPDGRMLGVDNRGLWKVCRPGAADPLETEFIPGRRRTEPGAVSPDGRRLVLIGRAWVGCESLTGCREFDRVRWEVTLDDGQEPTGAAFSPDSDRLAVMVRAWEGFERVWGVNIYAADTGEWLRWMDAEDDAFGPVWSPDGRFLAVVGRTAFDVWNAETWNSRVLRQPAGVRFTAAQFHPAGRELVTATDTGQVQSWDAGEWETPHRPGDPARPPARVLEWGVGPIQALAFSPDGSLGAVAGSRGDVVVWDADV